MLRRMIDHNLGGWQKFLVSVIGVSGAILSAVNHRGYWRICNAVASGLPRRTYYCVVALNDDSCMKIFLDDPYWSQLLASSYHYEPEFYRILTHLKEQSFAFLDCGANFGYWSIMLTSQALSQHPTVALEASQETYQHLEENNRRNHERFTLVYRAVAKESGQEVTMAVPNNDHASAHIQPINGGNGSGEVKVTTMSVDDIVKTYFPEDSRFVMKLDVEGQEIPALQGASHVLAQDTLLYYEDHGNDARSKVTQFVLDELQWLVFYVPTRGAVQSIHSVEEANAVKKRASCGYNFLACKQDSRFLEAIQGI